MQIPKNLAFLAASLLIIGAGCPKSNVSTNTNEALVLPSENGSESSAETSTDTETETDTESTDVTGAGDNAWQTYTNAALGFSFNWPDKGRYAPTWEVTFSKDGDESVKDGCYVVEGATTSKSTANGNDFCHTSVAVKDGVAKDYVATKVGGQNVVLNFTKRAPTGDAAFDWEEYQEELTHIVSTFNVKK